MNTTFKHVFFLIDESKWFFICHRGLQLYLFRCSTFSSDTTVTSAEDCTHKKYTFTQTSIDLTSTILSVPFLFILLYYCSKVKYYNSVAEISQILFKLTLLAPWSNANSKYLITALNRAQIFLENNSFLEKMMMYYVVKL